MKPDVERLVASPQVRTRHECRAPSSPEELWAAARRLSLRDTPRLLLEIHVNSI